MIQTIKLRKDKVIELPKLRGVGDIESLGNKLEVKKRLYYF